MVVRCPECGKEWRIPDDLSEIGVTNVACSCGTYMDKDGNRMPRTSQHSMMDVVFGVGKLQPRKETYLAHTCNCDADPTDRSFFKPEGHSETCPAKLGLLHPEPNLMRALEALKNRPEDQPLPTPSTSPDIADLVFEDLKARKLVGISRYGRALQAHNGRDAMRDAYEEALDLCNYLRQMIYERDGK